MKKTKTLYWIFTGLFAFLMLGSAIPNIISDPMSVEGFRKMNMPAYLLPFLGVAKALGVVAILIPGYPRLKEWAYAGFTFDFIFAAISHGAVDGINGQTFFPFIVLAILGVSYFYYHKLNPDKE